MDHRSVKITATKEGKGECACVCVHVTLRVLRVRGKAMKHRCNHVSPVQSCALQCSAG